MNILVQAIFEGRFSDAESIIFKKDIGLLINKLDSLLDLTPLMAAVSSESAFLVDALLHKRANPELKNKQGKTALILATEKGCFNLAEQILNFQYPVSTSNIENPNLSLSKQRFFNPFSIEAAYFGLKLNHRKYQDAALIWAVKNKNLITMEHALLKKANPNILENERNPILTIAAQLGSVDAALLLLRHDADVDIRDHDGKTPLMFAVVSKNIQLVDLLVRHGADVSLTDRFGHSAADHADHDSQDIKDYLIKHYEISKAVILAARQGNFIRVMTLGIQTPYFLTKKGLAEKAFFAGIREGHQDLVKFLLDHGVNINAEYNGGSALTDAGYHEKIDIAVYLIERGALIDSRDRFGKTVIFYAISTGDFNLVQYLINKNASINIEDSEGLTPLRWAVRHGYLDIVKLLIHSGANINFESTRENVNTALIDAAWIGFFEIVQVLVESGADISFKNYYPEFIAYHYATPIADFLKDQSDHQKIFDYLRAERLKMNPAIQQQSSLLEQTRSEEPLILRIPGEVWRRTVVRENLVCSTSGDRQPNSSSSYTKS